MLQSEEDMHFGFNFPSPGISANSLSIMKVRGRCGTASLVVQLVVI